MPRLSIDAIEHPAYLVNHSFELAWSNAAARSGALADFQHLAATADAGSVFKHLLQGRSAHDLESRDRLLRFHLALACPAGYDPDPGILGAARSAGAQVEITRDAVTAAQGADVLYTDVWTSMGQEDEAEQRRRDFAGYQIDRALLRHARREALVMHCLPAHRGEEISAEVIDGPQSVVFDQAENRLHTQKGILVWLSERAGPRR